MTVWVATVNDQQISFWFHPKLTTRSLSHCQGSSTWEKQMGHMTTEAGLVLQALSSPQHLTVITQLQFCEEAESSYPPGKVCKQTTWVTSWKGMFLVCEQLSTYSPTWRGKHPLLQKGRMRESKSRHSTLTCCSMDGWNSPEVMFKINVFKTSESPQHFQYPMIKWWTSEEAWISEF